MTEPLATRDPGRIVFVVVFIAGMILATFWVVQPFLPAAIWAATIVVATWPLLLRLQRVLWGRRSLAVAVMTTLLLLCLIVPLVVGLGSILAHADDIAGWLRSLATWFPPPAPDWLARVPVVGPRLAARWTELAAAGSGEVSARLTPYGGQIVGWIAETIGDLGLLLVHFILVVIFAAILYGSGETAAQATRRLAWRLAAARGEHSARLAVGAVRGVALGIVVTALVQGGLAAAGLAVAGVPFTIMLTGVIFVLSIAQIGPAPVLLGAVIWTYSARGSGWGTALLLWSLAVASLDNILRPILIRRGADLPLLLVFLGVIGGLLAFGIIGIFIGPVVLAVGYSLLKDWINTPPPPAATHAPREADHDLATV